MNKLRSLFQGILHGLKKKVKKPAEAAPTEKSEEEREKKVIEKINEGKKPATYGIRKQIVYGVAGVIVVAILTSFYLSTMDFGEKKKAEEDPYALPTTKGNQDGLPADYEEMNRLSEKYGDGVPGAPNMLKPPVSQVETENPGDNLQQQTATSAQTAQSSRQQLPDVPMIITQPRYPQYAPAVPGYPSPGGQKAPVVKEYDSAIRFSLKNESAESTETAMQPSRPNIADTVQRKNAKPKSQGYRAASNTLNLQVGTVIPAILITGINSDLEGQAIAQVREDVYDSLTGTTVLIPSGSRLIGRYSGKVNNGQSRINVEWSTLVYPSGAMYDLGSLIAIDGAGYAGLRDQVKNHTGKVLGAAAMTSALAALGSIAAGNTGDTDNYNAGQLAVQGAAGNLLNTASSLIQKNMNIQPTIIIRPGYTFNVMVNEPLEF